MHVRVAPRPDRRATERERAFPRDEKGLVRQCAWCRRVADRTGRFRLAADVLIDGATHGCCLACATALLRDYHHCA